ncbi:MAG: hypothetical protein LBE27_08715 [Deltaproteobacteria bacterium]|jgi:hypothetical protein|nr:hypothetical protein [Deltaproteobacteria bacterium]
MHLVTLASAKSADSLAQVQAGFTAPTDVPTSDIRLAAILLSAIILVGLVVAVIQYRKRQSKQKQGWSSISNAQTIWEILTKAVTRQANFILEIYENKHTITYKGILDSLEDECLLVLSLQDTPSTEVDFKGLPGLVHLNFRVAQKQPMDHYQFSTTIADSRFIKRQSWREAQLLLPIPKLLTSAQRRNFLRLEPSDSFAFNCDLYDVPEGGTITELSSLEKVDSGEVMDISIGGAQLKFPHTANLRETQRFIGIMQLPTEELDTEIQNSTLVILIQLINQEFVQGLDSYGKEPHSLLRVRFLGRYLQDPIQGNWVYRGLTQASLEDLSRWMLAYQRFEIKRQNYGNAPRGEQVPNMFPSTPPNRPPLKYS